MLLSNNSFLIGVATCYKKTKQYFFVDANKSKTETTTLIIIHVRKCVQVL